MPEGPCLTHHCAASASPIVRVLYEEFLKPLGITSYRWAKASTRSIGASGKSLLAAALLR